MHPSKNRCPSNKLVVLATNDKSSISHKLGLCTVCTIFQEMLLTRGVVVVGGGGGWEHVTCVLQFGVIHALHIA